MIKYRLLKFSGDKEVDGKATSIIGWESDGCPEDVHEQVVDDVLTLKISGIVERGQEYDGNCKRWVVTYSTIAKDVVVTIDKFQQKVVFVTDNDNLQVLFRVTESLLNLGYHKEYTYYLQKHIKCMWLTFKKKLHLHKE